MPKTFLLQENYLFLLAEENVWLAQGNLMYLNLTHSRVFMHAAQAEELQEMTLESSHYI